MTCVRHLLAASLFVLANPLPGSAQDAPTSTRPTLSTSDAGLLTLTIFLKHDESQTLDEINERLRRQHFYESFPPKGVEVLSWNVLMGIGQVVTLRFPGRTIARREPRHREDGLGRLSDRVLPDIRLPPNGRQGAEGLPSAFN